jgi:hypothetical protein
MKTLALILSVAGVSASFLMVQPEVASPVAKTLASAAHSVASHARCGCQLPAGVTLESINRDIAAAFGLPTS